MNLSASPPSPTTAVNHRFEIVVEHRDQAIARKRIRERSEAAQVAEPDDRVDRLRRAARDRAREHPLSGAMADVGVHQMACDSPRRLQLDDDCERLGDLGEARRLPHR